MVVLLSLLLLMCFLRLPFLRCCPTGTQVCPALNGTDICCDGGCLPQLGSTNKLCCPKALQVPDATGALSCCPDKLVYGPATNPQCCMDPNVLCVAPDGTKTCCSHDTPCDSTTGQCCPPATFPCPNNPLLPVKECCAQGQPCLNGR